MAEHHQLGETERKLKAREARTRLEQFIVGAANIAHNMRKAWIRPVTAQGRAVGQYALEERVVYPLSLECMICNSTTKCRCPMPKPKAMMGVDNTSTY